MRIYSETLTLKQEVFSILRDLIHERTGIFFDEKKRDTLAEKLTPLVLELGLTSFLDYYYYLKYDSGADAEWANVMDSISIQETYFWRETDQVKALAEVLAPQFFAEQPGRKLRIWSAACATGEEPLSIAIALNEAGWFDRARIEILASDASPSAIERARRGIYRERSFRNLPMHLRAKYFEEKQGRWYVSPDLHSRVNWYTANLMVEHQVAPLAASTAIFCRNAFIYFSESSVRSTVKLFHKQMPTPGYLFVGASESLFKITSDFDLREIGGAFVYVKR